MGKRAKSPAPTAPSSTRIHEATLGVNGAVVNGAEITKHQAEARRKLGFDVVVCGGNLAENRRLAGEIERAANGSSKRCPPHASAGAHALPHCQPDPRPPAGHTFYETPNRKAF
jgi:hypothetical protein